MLNACGSVWSTDTSRMVHDGLPMEHTGLFEATLWVLLEISSENSCRGTSDVTCSPKFYSLHKETVFRLGYFSRHRGDQKDTVSLLASWLTPLHR